MFSITIGKKDKEIVEKTQESEVSQLKAEIEQLKTEFSRVQKNYQTWLEDSHSTIKELRDRIEKKINYVNRNNDEIDLKDAFRKKHLRKILGIRNPAPKSLNIPLEEEALNGEKEEENFNREMSSL